MQRFFIDKYIELPADYREKIDIIDARIFDDNSFTNLSFTNYNVNGSCVSIMYTHKDAMYDYIMNLHINLIYDPKKHTMTPDYVSVFYNQNMVIKVGRDRFFTERYDTKDMLDF